MLSDSAKHYKRRARHFLNRAMTSRAGLILSSLRPAHWPIGVIRSGGMSDWSETTPIRFVTSFNHALFAVTGRRCIESFRKANPQYECVAYIESIEKSGEDAMEAEVLRFGARAVRLSALPLLKKFFDLARDVIPREYGGDAPDESFAPTTATQTGDYFRKNMIRWFRKVVAIEDATRGFNGVVVWMDCDCYSKAPLPRERLARAFGGAGVFYMKANRHMTEMGLAGFDCGQPGVRGLVEEMVGHYMERRFLPLRNWDDCVTFDRVRAARSLPVCRDIGLWSGADGHILRTTMLSPYLEHDKGAHGRGGERIPLT